MVAVAATYHLRANAERRMVDFDTDDTLQVVDLGQPQGAGNKCLPLVSPGFPRRFLAGLFRSVGANTVEAFSIIAATAVDGTGAVAVVSHALAAAPDAVGDTLWLECTIEQVREVLPTATHVGVQVHLANAGDECVMYFERAELQHATAAPTADYIGA
jgi:hypothetical protein